MISMKLHQLKTNKELTKAPEKMFDIEHESSASLLSALCEDLNDTSALEFSVEGFGQQHWPVDIRTDLAVVMEQLEEIILKMNQCNFSFELDFYEQGIERYLSFYAHDQSSFLVKCKSLTKWKPDPIEEVISIREFQLMLVRLTSTFREVAEVVSPSILNHELLRSFWSQIDIMKARIN